MTLDDSVQTVSQTSSNLRDVPKGVTGFLHINTEPQSVSIYIDNKKRGLTPKTNLFALSAGIHELVLRKEGFIDHRRTLNIKKPDTVSVRICLQQLIRKQFTE